MTESADAVVGSSAHPGGGVHGACGLNAARAALGDRGMSGLARRRLVRMLAALAWHGTGWV